MPITHEEQRQRWEEEHRTPTALKQMDARTLSGGVEKFLGFLLTETTNFERMQGIEMGCGKGRNVIGLAKNDAVAKMSGFDFSEAAIAEAKKRAAEEGVSGKTQFDVMDAANTWKYPDDSFDFGVDCFASTDIEDPAKRKFAVREMHRVLKPGGYFLVYVMSTEDEYHRMMAAQSPAEEKGAFYNSVNGKFEKSFSEEELNSLYADFKLIKGERVEKTTEFFGKTYGCKHHWRIYQK